MRGLPTNLSSRIVSYFLADDMSDWEEYNLEKARYLLQNGSGAHPTLLYYAHGDSKPRLSFKISDPENSLRKLAQTK